MSIKNSELLKLFGDSGIIGRIKAQRLRWLGHMTRETCLLDKNNWSTAVIEAMGLLGLES